MKGSERSSRVAKRSTDNKRQSCSSSGHSRRSLSTNKRASSTSTGRKRKSSTSEDASCIKKSNVNSTRIFQRKIINNRKYDAFCWICHTVADEFYCPNCPRVYHNDCLKKVKSNSSECSCRFTTVDGLTTCRYEQHDFKQLALGALRKVTYERNKKGQMKENKLEETFKHWSELMKKDFLYWSELMESDLLCKTMDTYTLMDSCLNEYTSTGEFYQDAKWIYHNCVIIAGFDNEVSALAKQFEKSLKEELSDLDSCAECYREKCGDFPEINFFTKVCSRRHPIVWAKIKGYPFWPAKCLRVVNGHADVRFFGTHDKSSVPLNQVYKISRRNPGGEPKKTGNPLRMSSYEESMAEFSAYVLNYENKYGIFEYHNDKTTFHLVKKSRKRAHQVKSKDQLDTSIDRAIYGCNKVQTNDSSPQLNVSCLNEDPIETKAALRSACVYIENHAEKGNENSTVSSVAKDLVCSMTFDTAEECPDEGDVSDEVIEATSKSLLKLPETGGKLSVNSINSSEMCENVSSTEILNNSEAVETISDIPINANACGDSSVLCSTSSPFLITSTHSLSKNFSDSVNETLKINLKDGEFQFPDNNIKVVYESSPEFFPRILPEDDDIQIVKEYNPRCSIEEAMEKKFLTKTMCEILLGTRPNIRKLITTFQSLAMHFYLQMWLDINKGRYDPSEVSFFHRFYVKQFKKNESYKTIIRRKDKQIAELNEKIAALQSSDERKTAMKNQLYEAQCRNEIEIKSKLKKDYQNCYRLMTSTKRNLIAHKHIIKELTQQLATVTRLNTELKKTIRDFKMEQHSKKKDLQTVMTQTEDGFINFSKDIMKTFKFPPHNEQSVEHFGMPLNFGPSVCHPDPLQANIIKVPDVSANMLDPIKAGMLQANIIKVPDVSTSMISTNVLDPNTAGMQSSLFNQPTMASQPGPVIQFPMMQAQTIIQNSSIYKTETYSRKSYSDSRLVSKYTSSRNCPKSSSKAKLAKRTYSKNDLKKHK